MKENKDKFLRHHTHSGHSVRDGLLKIKDMVTTAAKAGEAFSLTDHGTVSGWMEMRDEARKTGIRPVYGIELYINRQRDELLRLRDEANGATSAKAKSTAKKAMEGIRKNSHLVVLAKDMVGYKNIIGLNNSGYLDGFYGKPIVRPQSFLAVGH